MSKHNKTPAGGMPSHHEPVRQHGRRRPLRAKLGLIIPLVSSLAVSQACRGDDLCTSYNETTIELNKPADGRTAGLARLRACEGLCDDLIDLINETHRLSSEGMPADIRVTAPPDSCFHRSWGELPAYAVQKSRSESGRGVYLSSEAESSGFSKLMRMLAHEIGHLQKGNPVHGAEVISQLNSYEQFLMGFVLFQRQGASQSALKEWLGYIEQDGLAQMFTRGRETLIQGADPSIERYAKSNIFIFMKLAEHEGDFGAVRNETAALTRSCGLDGALDDYAARSISGYSGMSIGELSKEVRALFLKTLSARFEGAVADAFRDVAFP
ncbi:MAG: hypothetical protein AB1295_02490 [Candidatus Micrarchaeota archaeon]